MATQQQFLNLLQDIEPSRSTKDACAGAHNWLRNGLATHQRFKDVHVNTFLSGSYARDTALRPRTVDGRTRRPDVDIIVVTSHTTADRPADVIALLRRTLKQLGYDELQSNRRSVTVTMSAVEMDVVPIIQQRGFWGGTGWLIPDKNEDSWIATNPMGHNEWASAVNKRTHGNFKPLVKLTKWWKRENLPNLRRPKGFILETLVAKHMPTSQLGYEELFVRLLEAIVSEYQWTVFTGGIPNLADPSVEGNDVFSRVKPEEFERFYNMAKQDAQLLRRAQKETNPEKALALYQRVFGDRFKGPGTRNSGSLLQTAVGGGLAFPAKAVLPPANKPAGFA